MLSFCFFHVTCTDEPQDPPPPLGEPTIDMLQGNSVEAAFQKPSPVQTVHHICRVQSWLYLKHTGRVFIGVSVVQAKHALAS